MTSLPAEVLNLLPQPPSTQWRRYARRVLRGHDGDLSLAFVDFLYAASLSGAQKFGELAKLESTRRSPVDGEAADLRALTRDLVFDARIRTAKSVLPLWSQIAERMSSSPSHSLSAALPDTVSIAVARAGKEVVALEKVPEWARAAKLNGVQEGFAASRRTIDLYLRAGEQMQLIRVERASGKTKLLAGREAEGAFREHCRRQIRDHSRPGFRLANVLRAEGGYRILMANRSVRLTVAEATRLSRGERLPPDHRLSRILADDPSFVVYSHPLMTREGRYRADADRIAFGIQRSYPELRVFKDDLSDQTAERAEAVRQFVINDPADVLVLKADDSFHVDDANILKDILDELKSGGIRVEEIAPQMTPDTPGRSRLVIAISGHIDEKLAEFVRKAGEAGYFRDNIVMFNSCASELNAQLVHEMNTRYGAVATWRYEGKIPAAKVQDILMKLRDEMPQKPTLDDWKRYVQEEGLIGVWNICLLQNGTATEEVRVG